jgi:FAD/FMN-containing dehydrogenase
MAGLVSGSRVYPTSGASWCRTRASPRSDAIKPHGLWFPVDISAASRATIGGMVGNNSCGARSLRYGNTRENVLSIDAIMADGLSGHFGPAARDLSDLPLTSPVVPLARDLLGIAAANSREIETNFPKVQRRVGGYAGNGQDVGPTPSPRVVLRLIAGLGQLMHGFATATVASKPDPLTKFDDFDGADPHRIATSGAVQHARSLPYYRQRVPSYHLDCAPTLGGA